LALREALERRFGDVSFEVVSDLGGLSRRLEAYFLGDLGALTEISVDPGGTPFQQKVWSALQRISVGRTISYTDLARGIGQPTAFRAVATANAQNPVAVVVPCHRVIHANGSVSGYGGGFERKRWLLRHEGALLC
jgi:methylated-DNA-[protein]-cysteine S-methyltransferase